MRKPKKCGTTHPRFFLHKDDIMPCEEVKVTCCTNCKFFKPETSWYREMQVEYGLCTHPHSTCIDAVSGIPEYYEALDMRQRKSFNIDDLHLCTPAALYFEPAPTTQKTKPKQVNQWVIIVLCIILIILFCKV